MTREEAIDAMLDVRPCDWWRFVACRTCNAYHGEGCQAVDGPARGPHIARRRAALVLHGTLWLLDNGYAADVLGGQDGPETGPGAPGMPEVTTGPSGRQNGSQSRTEGETR